MSCASRGQALQAYKNLLTLGRSYPRGYDHFRDKLRAAFDKNRNVTDPAQVTALLGKCDRIAGELRTLYMLRQYANVHKRVSQEAVRRQQAQAARRF